MNTREADEAASHALDCIRKGGEYLVQAGKHLEDVKVFKGWRDAGFKDFGAWLESKGLSRSGGYMLIDHSHQQDRITRFLVSAGYDHAPVFPQEGLKAIKKLPEGQAQKVVVSLVKEANPIENLQDTVHLKAPSAVAVENAVAKMKPPKQAPKPQPSPEPETEEGDVSEGLSQLIESVIDIEVQIRSALNTGHLDTIKKGHVESCLDWLARTREMIAEAISP